VAIRDGAAFHNAAQRTGVIMDLGVHVIDFYEFLFHPNWNLVSATHDGFRGPEGLAEMELEANGAPISIRLSRYQQQSNVARITFDNAEIAINNVGGLNMDTCTISDKSGSTRYVTASPSIESYYALADEFSTSWPCKCAVRALSLRVNSYSRPSPISQPWSIFNKYRDLPDQILLSKNIHR
jgi:hypothetical protein